MMKMKNRILAIPAAAAAIPKNPNTAAMIATMRNTTAQLNMVPPLRGDFNTHFTQGPTENTTPVMHPFRLFYVSAQYTHSGIATAGLL